MADNAQPHKEDGLPLEPTEAETEFLNSCYYEFIDMRGYRRKPPSRGPSITEMKPYPPPAPPKDKDKQG